MSWDEAYDVAIGERTGWDVAYESNFKPVKIQDPNEAAEEARNTFKYAVDMELPLTDAEENYDELLAWDKGETFDPSEPPKMGLSEYKYDPDLQFEVDPDLQKLYTQREAGRTAGIQEFFGIDPETGGYREEEPTYSVYPSGGDPSEPPGPKDVEVPTKRDMVVSLNDDDLKYVLDSTIKNPKAYPKELKDAASHEYRVRRFAEQIRNLSEGRQTAFFTALPATNIFGASWFSQHGLDPAEILTGQPKKDKPLMLEAAARVLAEKNDVNPVNVSRIANMGSKILTVALEFWLTPNAELAKAPAAIRPLLQTGVKFATREAMTLPRQGETAPEKLGSITESFMMGIGIGGAGKFIPKARYRIPAVVGGMAGVTYARTGDIERTIETGITVMGFEALGLMQRAGQFTKGRLRNKFANQAVRAARKQNPDLYKFSNKEVGDILDKLARNFSDHTGRDLSHTNARGEAQRAWKLKQGGDSRAWDKLVQGYGFGQVEGKAEAKPAEIPAKGKPVAELPPATPAQAKPSQETIRAALTKQETLGTYEEDAGSGVSKLIEVMPQSERNQIVDNVRKNEGDEAAGIVQELLANEIQTVDTHLRENDILVHVVGMTQENAEALRNIKGVTVEDAGRMGGDYISIKRTAQATPEGAVTEGKEEAVKELPDATIARKAVTVEGKTYHPVTIPTESIGVDAKRFQFKLGAKLRGGVTEALKDVDKFDPVKGGQVLVWQDKAGKYWVVDGHHRVALAKKTGFESLDTWVIREADGWSAADARAVGALRNLSDGKGTAVDAAKLFRDSGILLEQLRKEGVPTNNAIVQQGMDMKNLSDYVFRLVIDERLPANMAAAIGKHVKGPTQQKQVADLILEGEVDTVRQAELLAMTIDNAPVLTKSEQTLFGLETSEKSLFAERAKILANVEKRLKTNKKVFGTLSKQAGLIETKGNVLAKDANLAAKEKAEEVLFLLEKLANAKGPVAEALNEATKEYAENPTKENLTKVTSSLLDKWTEGPASLRVQKFAEVSELPLERSAKKEVEPDLFKPKGKPGFVDVSLLADTHAKAMNILDQGHVVKQTHGEDVYAEVIKGIHRADVAMIEFNEKELETLDGNLRTFGEALSKYPNRILEMLMLSRGKPFSKEAIAIQGDAMAKLQKEAPELVGTRGIINRIADFNYGKLQEVVGDEISYVEDYFYGIYKDPRKVERFLDHWKTTKRFTKEKKLPTVADAKAYDLTIRDPNPIHNLQSEYIAIARLEGMIDLKTALLKSGKGKYIDTFVDAPIEWEKIKDPVFADVRAEPELAKMINNLISTNKITRMPWTNALRQVNNFLRTVKFIGSAFHLGVEAKQSLADSGYLGFLHKKTARAGLTTGFRKSDPIFQTAEYKDYVAHGGGHRYSVDSEAQRAFSDIVAKMNKAGTVLKAAALPVRIPEAFVRWMFESYIPELKYSKYLLDVAEQEKKRGRSLTSAEKIDIGKAGQNFYGMMNERLFGRSGTATSVLRFYFMAPGFSEGNHRSIYDGMAKWGEKGGHRGARARANVINSFIISATAATIGTLIFTG